MKRNPRKVTWTVLYRRKHKKGIEEEATRKRTRRTQKFQRAIVGASLNEILAKRNMKPEVRKAQREQAIKWVVWSGFELRATNNARYKFDINTVVFLQSFLQGRQGCQEGYQGRQEDHRTRRQEDAAQAKGRQGQPEGCSSCWRQAINIKH